jgi:ligand-binding SRPBCC domain-containing protein
MPSLHLTTFIAAPAKRVFDLSRSINLHKISTMDTQEDAIAGTTTGLINLNETVTWRAKHLYKVRQFTSKIMEMKMPVYFVDEMLHGDFKRFRHEHHFKDIHNGTIMIDVVEFESPYGLIGRLFNKFYLENYMKTFLIKRNNVIKKYAETDRWKVILN